MLVKLGALTGNTADMRPSQGEYGDAFSKPYVDAIASGRAVAVANCSRTAPRSNALLRTAIGRAWSGAQTAARPRSREADREITALLREGR